MHTICTLPMHANIQTILVDVMALQFPFRTRAKNVPTTRLDDTPHHHDDPAHTAHDCFLKEVRHACMLHDAA